GGCRRRCDFRSRFKRLGQLDAVERGLADLLVHFEEIKNGGRTARAEPAQESGPVIAAAPAPAPAPSRPATVAAPAPAPTQVHAQSSPLDLIPELPPEGAPEMMAAPDDVLELQPEPMAPPPPAPMPAPQPEARQRKSMPRGPALQPIDPNLPPDTPLEPGSGAPRVRPGSAAARIAASEAALGNSRPTATESGGKSAAIAAARNAAKAAYLDTPVKV